LAQSCGWSIEYIVWNLSVQQIILLAKAGEALNSKDDEKIRLEDAENPDEIFKQMFGVDVFEGR